MKGRIQALWEANQPKLAAEMETKLARGDIYILYDIQLYTNNLLRYACLQGEDDLLDGVCSLYMPALDALTIDCSGARWVFGDSSTSNAELRALLGQEVPLISSQFLCAVAEAVAGIARLDAMRRSPGMLLFVRKFMPVLMDFYRRQAGPFFGRMEKALGMPYPPMAGAFDWALPVFDDYLFFIAAMAHLLGAQAAAPDLVLLPEDVAGCYRSFVRLGCELLRKRMTPSAFTDFEGRPVAGLNFDLGVWDGFEDYAYTGYAGEEYPGEACKRAARNVGWDISHARRFVNVFDALYDNRQATGIPFPGSQVMAGLANQLVYGAFNRDFNRPLFTNFMDGTNGWYRVGYAGRQGFGYPPWGLSDAVPTGGYGFWSRFNPDVARVMGSILSLLEEEAAVDVGDRVRFVEKYYPGLELPDSLARLMFFPSVCP